MSKLEFNHEPNEIRSEFMHLLAMSVFPCNNSASRNQMFGSHFSQNLVVKGSTPRLLSTGVERKFGKHTFSVEMPADGMILDLIEMYPATMGADSIRHNPYTLVIYEDANTRKIGCFEIKGYHSSHQYFGFMYKHASTLSRIRVGAQIPKGTKFLVSPNLEENGDYHPGVSMNVAMMSHPATSEDGIMISRSALEKLKFTKIITREVEWGSDQFPLNVYGDETRYQPFPEIGQYIKENDVLMALRDVEPESEALANRSKKHARQIEYTFDNTIYVPAGNAQVVDIVVYKDSKKHARIEGSNDQCAKYVHSRQLFAQKLHAAVERYRRNKRGELVLTPKLHSLLVKAQAVLSDTDPKQPKISRQFKCEPLDVYRVEFVLKQEVLPNIGNKGTDTYGGKGVFCHIAEDHEMPVDKDGNRADIVTGSETTIGRTNPGRLYEQYVSSACVKVHRQICEMAGIRFGEKNMTTIELKLQEGGPELLSRLREHVVGFYRTANQELAGWFDTGVIEFDEAMAALLLHGGSIEGVALHLPHNNDLEPHQIVDRIESSIYRPIRGQVTYVGNSGRVVTTKEPVRVGPLYFMLLEKVGDDWGAVSSAKLQTTGVLTGNLSRDDKYGKPSRPKATRVIGEAEGRIIAACVGSTYYAELMDRHNNPITHEASADAILTSDTPTNIDRIVNREEIGLGGAKSLQMANHFLEVSGRGFAFKEYVPMWGQKPKDQ